MATYSSIGEWQDQADYKVNDVVSGIPFGYKVISLGLYAYNNPYTAGQAGIYKNGSQIDSAGRSYNLTKINKSNGTIVSNTEWDVYANSSNGTNLGVDLSQMPDTYWCILYSHDEPETNHLNGTLSSGVYDVGGSPEKYSERIYLHGSYVLFGGGDMKESNGQDFTAGNADDDVNAMIEKYMFIPPSSWGDTFNIQKPTEYYICIQDHTSSSGSQPPSQSTSTRDGGGSWTSYWADMREFIWTPHYQSALQIETILNTTDGSISSDFQEEKPDSINQETQSHTLEFKNIRDRQLQAMITFLEYHHDRTFTFSKDFILGQDTSKYRVSSYQHTWINYNINSLTINIKGEY